MRVPLSLAATLAALPSMSGIPFLDSRLRCCGAGRERQHFALSAMLTVSQLSKSFAGRALFDDVSLQVNRGDRIGLVGPNGAGKSTLFALLLGEISPDKGSVAIEKNATIGFLPQETAAAGDETVLELALAVSPELVHAQKVIKKHEAGREDEDDDEHPPSPGYG